MSDGNEPKLGSARVPQVPTTVFASMLTPVVPDNDVAQASAPAVVPAAKQAAANAPLASEADPPKVARAAKAPATKAAAKAPAAQRATASAPPRGEPRSVADRGIQVSLPASLDARLQKHWKATGLSHPQILFTAIESVYDRLPALVSTTVAQSTSGRTLFNRPPAVVRRHDEGEPRNTFVIRITEENKATIDALWTEVGAPSRNAMLIAAYDAFLPND